MAIMSLAETLATTGNRGEPEALRNPGLPLG